MHDKENVEEIVDKTVNKVEQYQDQIVLWCNDVLGAMGLSGDWLIYTRTLLLTLVVVGVSFGLWWGTRKVLLSIIHTFAAKSKTKWDDYLVKYKFFSALAHLVPLLLMETFVRTIFYSFPNTADFFTRLVGLAIILAFLFATLRFLNASRDILMDKPALKDKPMVSIFQLVKIVVNLIMVIVMISVAFKIDLIVVLTSMGAMTAVILLVFKDTILGFVGSVQLASNDMIRIGDWVTMDKFGADGDVLEITLNTVKVQNFDRTITTIPTYSFISDSFKNWRGMAESDGRRIKRSINIEVDTIKYCSPEMLAKFKKVNLISSYVKEREEEIQKWNVENAGDDDILVNGRSQTNIGVFRHYMLSYLKSNPNINQEMTLLVRQLDPTANGVPMEIYCFSKTKDWGPYENIVADIFDHLYAAARYFELEVFENPSGSDFKGLVAN